jgi:hypothetical protein
MTVRSVIEVVVVSVAVIAALSGGSSNCGGKFVTATRLWEK